LSLQIGFLLFIALAQATSVVSNPQHENRGELLRLWTNALDASTSHSVDHFRKLFDEHATYVFNMGNISVNNDISGVEKIQKSMSMWFPKGSDAKASVHVLFESSDRSMSFVAGKYCLTLPSREHTTYRWSALVHWAGNRVVKYSIFGDFTHCLNTIKAGKLVKDEL
jgi:hypothetical protein